MSTITETSVGFDRPPKLCDISLSLPTSRNANGSLVGLGQGNPLGGLTLKLAPVVAPVREAMSEVYIHLDQQVTTKKAPYLHFTTEP